MKSHSQTLNHIKNISSALSQMLSITQIYRHSQLLKALTPNMKLDLCYLRQIPLLRTYTEEELYQILSNCPQLSLQQVSRGDTVRKQVKIHYPNLDRQILITGVKCDAISKWLLEYQHIQSRKNHIPRLVGRIVVDNGFWIAVQCIEVCQTQMVIGFLRHKKKFFLQKTCCKIENRKVRIMRASQNLFQFLIGAQADFKNQSFLSSIDNGHLIRQKQQGPGSSLIRYTRTVGSNSFQAEGTLHCENYSGSITESVEHSVRSKSEQIEKKSDKSVKMEKDDESTSHTDSERKKMQERQKYMVEQGWRQQMELEQVKQDLERRSFTSISKSWQSSSVDNTEWLD